MLAATNINSDFLNLDFFLKTHLKSAAASDLNCQSPCLPIFLMSFYTKSKTSQFTKASAALH